MEEENKWYLIGRIKCPKVWSDSTRGNIKIEWILSDCPVKS